MRAFLALLILASLSCGGSPAGQDPIPDAGPGPGETPDAATACEVDLDCDDGVACTLDLCDPASKTCTRTPNDSFCDNDYLCDGQEVCDPSAGCQPGEPPMLPPGAECIDPMVSAGNYHTCALTPSGGVRCWGHGAKGQLGYGNTIDVGDNETPATMGDVVLEPGLVIQVVAGGLHSCALFVDGAVQCWGFGENGQLGYGNPFSIGDNEVPADYAPPDVDPELAPPAFVDVGGKAVQLAAHTAHTCALLESGKVRCWGRSGEGQLGYADIQQIGDNEVPSSVAEVDVGGRVLQVVTGGAHTCALLENGKVRCWGRGDNGALGYGSEEDVGDNETPASVGDVDVGGTVVQLAAGGSHTCALLIDGNVRCWGLGEKGQLGYPGGDLYVGDNETPASVGDVDVGGRVVQIVAGGTHTCALLDTGKVRCWGEGLYGRLGYGNESNIGDNETPASAGDVDVGGRVVRITAGGSHTCAMLEGTQVRCWGNGGTGRLGYGDLRNIGNDPGETPASVGNVPYYE